MWTLILTVNCGIHDGDDYRDHNCILIVNMETDLVWIAWLLPTLIISPFIVWMSWRLLPIQAAG